MLKIKKLKISGFKSFPYPKEIDISDGITGVIGPNGCGKSNIFEAIRWVMGETSSKSLRSSSMDEVIFSGTQKLPAKNFAEVSIEIENRDKENEKLLVTRSIQRGVGSFFKINNKDVRAKDVTMLFSDSGSGPRSSSIISQGNIDQIINFKPLERKIILEDAAGISGLQSRRRDSELKLLATEKNLDRLNDIIKNLEKQVLSLKRQARQAENYQNITEKILQNEQYYYFIKWQNLEKEIINNQNKLRISNDKVKNLLNMIESFNNKKEHENKKLKEIQLRLTNLNRILGQKEFDKNELKNKKKNIEIRNKEILDYIFTFNKDAESEKKRLKEINENISKIQNSLNSMEIPNELISDLKKFKSEELTLITQINDLESRFFSEMQLSLGEEFKKDNIKESINKLKRKKKEVSTEIKKLDYEIMIKERKFKDKKSKDIEKKIKFYQETLVKKQNVCESFESKNVLITSEKDKVSKEIEKISYDLTKNATELETLKTVSKNIDFSDKSIFKLLKIKKGYEKAIFTALNYELDAQLDDSKKRWEFNYDTKLSELPENIESLLKYVEVPKELMPLLSQYGYAKTIDDGFIQQKKLKIGQYLVSKSGELWRWDGLYCEKETEISKIFEFKNRVKKLEEIINSNKNQLAHINKKKELFIYEIENNNKEILKIKNEIESLKNYFDIEKKKLIEFQNEKILERNLIEKLSEKKKFLNNELTKLLKEIIVLDNQQKADGKGSTKKKDVSEKKKLEISLSILKKELSEKKDNINELNKKILAIEIKTKYWKNNIEENLKRKKESEEQLSNFYERVKNLEEEKQTIQKNPKAYEDEIKSLEIEISKINTDYDEQNLRQENIKNQVSSHEREINYLDNEKLSNNNNIIRIEENLSHQKNSLTLLSNEIVSKYKVTPKELLSNNQYDDQDKTCNIADLEKIISQLKIKRDLIGPVNLRAKIEQDDIFKELNELTNERDDIQLAIKKLRNSIQNINTEGRSRLIKAYEKVNNNFSDIFSRLFTGGQAHLELIGSDDPLQTGIEIFARPPGKKLTSINLLSGGEKALTAISLIFSIFLINPSPICILDEVDAALDDSNVEKFCKILRELKDQTSTKFLIITHHKTTMSMVDRIYGVTMMQKGISDLVKVDFEERGLKVAI